MITKTLKTSIFIIALASFSFTSAQETVEAKKDNSEKMFNHLDINSDDLITLDEFKTMQLKDPSKATEVEKRFETIDTDKNGTVDRAEFKAFMEQPKAAKMSEKKLKVKPTKG